MRESHTGLEGLNASTSENEESSSESTTGAEPPTVQKPVSPKQAETSPTSGMQDIEELEERVAKMEREMSRGEGKHTPLVANPECPSKEEVEAHNATHGMFQNWCKHCVRGMATRDKHARKKKEARGQYRRTKFGEVDVPDTEEPKKGASKFSMDYMKSEGEGEDSIPSTVVMVNLEDGGVFAYATPGKGLQGDRYWLPQRIAKDIDNCGTTEVQVFLGLARHAIEEGRAPAFFMMMPSRAPAL